MALFRSHRSTSVTPLSPTPLDYATARLLLRRHHLTWIDARQQAMDIVRENRPERSEVDAEVIAGFRFGEAQLIAEAQ
jgi:hypothetical protein